MSRRLSAAEKGKGSVVPADPPRAARVKVPDFDPAELVHDHDLILVGRITNPKIQKLWALLPFLADHWKVTTKPVGADLGQGRFQYQFASEADIQKVLDNRPYHFAHWMIIIQRWEPTVAPSFPSQIPFWIQVQGVPSHLWSKVTLVSLASNIGHYETSDITKTAAKMRVTVNGLLPLITSSTLEFSNGDEVQAELVYEKLEKHCSKCWRLDHDYKDCPEVAVVPPVRSEFPGHQVAEGKGLLTRGLPAVQRESKREKSKRDLPRALLSSPESPEVPSRRRPPLERSPAVTQEFDPTPQAALQTALGEVRDFMTSYSNCPDPTESAARKERARLAEEQGEYEETAAHMVRAAMAYEEQQNILTLRSVEEMEQLRESALSPARLNLRLPERDGVLPLSQDRFPVRLRLGPINATSGLTPPPPVKRKPGRPPGKRLTVAAALALGSKKRKVAGFHPSPRRSSKQQKEKTGKAKDSQRTTSKAGTSGFRRKLVPGFSQATGGDGSDSVPGPSVPQTGVVPSSRLKMKIQKDFQKQSSPLP
ncbi:hypothetical protein AALP_AA5G041400 [Arabis alpina]|uniref:DUF4283 domain-containing protein n=1 Tax=Arabis alpina TaxID=50452 RepID=A0A087GUU6_ARAAL|nr:hypothetical protein AALP_AA5G041400 [Arabis alpina]